METIVMILKEIKEEVDYLTENKLVTNEILDSLDIMELIDSLEERFGISIGMEDIAPEKFDSVESISELVRKLGGDI